MMDEYDRAKSVDEKYILLDMYVSKMGMSWQQYAW
jgi:hypothetical protein